MKHSWPTASALVAMSLPQTCLAQCPGCPPQYWTVVHLYPQESSKAEAVRDGHQAGSAGSPHGAAGTWSGSAGSWLPLDQPWSEANGIDGDQTVGFIDDVVSGITHAMLWQGTPSSSVDLHPPGNFDRSNALAVQGGQQVGYAATNASGARAFLWSGSAASGVSLHPAGATSSMATGVFSGRQVGFAFLDGQYRAGMWTGTAASWSSLHPEGMQSSRALATDETEQAGYAVTVSGFDHACMWRGTPQSWVNLHPSGAALSAANAVHGGWQAGWAWAGGDSKHAGLWAGSAESWIDLHSLVSSEFLGSEARGVWTDGTIVFVVGTAYVNGYPGSPTAALMWVGSPCYANCDHSMSPPVLNVLDFNCFLNAFSSGASYANCDGSTTPPALNVLDFNCFLNRFSLGCP
jgi:hypothetical protein